MSDGSGFEQDRDRIRGCLIGGAAGDALGYAVEFLRWRDIEERYGSRGITQYALQDGLARISDDTQMTMFTVNGIILSRVHQCDQNACIRRAYLDWYQTQTSSYDGGGGEGAGLLRGLRRRREPRTFTWLADLPEMYVRRAPGNTCLSALSEGAAGTVRVPCNNSKGCGGVMRAAPIGVTAQGRCLDYAEGADAAAITHGHPLGWLPAAALTHIVHVFCHYEQNGSLPKIAKETAAELEQIYPSYPEAAALRQLIEKAIALAEQPEISDRAAIGQLGEGWVGEEALAIALYCAVKYRDDFDRMLTAAVNHDGDSDSTGAIAGNILGLIIGYDAIPEKYKTDLELHDTILTLADDLCTAWKGTPTDPVRWERKYGACRRRLM
jgi:ADP-ribosylglycohydrolase